MEKEGFVEYKYSANGTISFFIEISFQKIETISMNQKCLKLLYKGARCVMVIVVGNGHGKPNLKPNEFVCISHSTNTLAKAMNPTIFPPVIGK